MLYIVKGCRSEVIHILQNMWIGQINNNSTPVISGSVFSILSVRRNQIFYKRNCHYKFLKVILNLLRILFQKLFCNLCLILVYSNLFHLIEIFAKIRAILKTTKPLNFLLIKNHQPSQAGGIQKSLIIINLNY